MSNSTNKSTRLPSYTITNEQVQKLIEKIPSLQNNNKNTEYILKVQTNNGAISVETPASQAKNESSGTLQLQFSYDFVQDRWFLNDNRIHVIDRN